MFKKFVDDTCFKFHINLEQIEDKNCAFVIGHDHIQLGQFEDEELKVISFVHEIGHILSKWSFKRATNFNTLMIELDAWHEGLKFAAEECGLIFSDSAIKWAYGQACSYAGHDERERMSWKPERWLKTTVSAE